MAAATIKVMPFGASIVEGGCWRAYLQKSLKESGTSNFDFVGGQSGPTECKLNNVVVDFDKNNEGHSGAKAQEFVANSNLIGWLKAATPQIIMMHLGTNDVKANRKTEEIIGDYSVLLSQMRAQNANVQLLVMKLIPLRTAGNDAAWVAAIPKLNDAIANWAKDNTKTTSPITVVDMFTGFNADTMTTDGTHPNEEGNKLMSSRLSQPLKDAIKARG
ncbi:carbohydrate esterase family 3 protein [Lentithecium fluviatile CBS 122367]|uniref:Carbohydrate esterase family 3 protein n=1 Tax=Lentithecium fluviatile CBS 122367 TaxID=1168545 RepID=A0A6G1IVH6_9PLEO|nr:carbohydrate esterase family 3 protein [Lentithecium fluviatile CBS 122367]